MILFETDKKPLLYLLDQIDNRDLALPDFARSYADRAPKRRLPRLVARNVKRCEAGRG